MNTDVLEAAEAIRAAGKSVPGLRIYEDPAATVDPPAMLVGAPVLQLQGISSEPTRAVFPVMLVVAQNKAALNKLLSLVPEVIAAIRDQVEDAEVLDEVTPAVVTIGTTELPGYMIFVEV